MKFFIKRGHVLRHAVCPSQSRMTMSPLRLSVVRCPMSPNLAPLPAPLRNCCAPGSVLEECVSFFAFLAVKVAPGIASAAGSTGRAPSTENCPPERFESYSSRPSTRPLHVSGQAHRGSGVSRWTRWEEYSVQGTTTDALRFKTTRWRRDAVLRKQTKAFRRGTMPQHMVCRNQPL